MLTNKIKTKVSTWGLAAIVFAAASVAGNSHATNYFAHPADVISGSCGTGSLTVSVYGQQFHVPCENIDTHTGEAYIHYNHCNWFTCISYRKDIQLSVLKVKKLAYRDGHLINTHDSDDFHINVSDNSTYYKNLSLKSKQKRSLLVTAGHYSIHESAAGYDESIDCGDAGRSHNGRITVGVHPGSIVECTVRNDLIPVHPPVVVPAAPAHCYVTIHGTLAQARIAYAHQCHLPRIDCDPVAGGWTCSSRQIGNASPGNRTPRQQ